ncbi:MAG: hypothetical protein Ct9H300mP15_18780 [Gemmatimonadota bacterium]|nr:MAG: hypothetical protein Ct9H300mP15_18780 [Gemmatimonadota bacterium]
MGGASGEVFRRRGEDGWAGERPRVHRLGQVLQKGAMRSSLGAWRFEIFSGDVMENTNLMLFSFPRRCPNRICEDPERPD